MNKAIVVNIGKCMACKSCELACALVHSKSKVLEDAITESPAPQNMVAVEQAGEFGIPMQCRHCADAPCVSICPTAAMHRHEVNSPVLIDKDKCIGCRMCVMACPFGAIDITRDGKAVVKCDLCIERTKAGENPSCVESCPTGALEYRELSEYLIEQRRSVAAQALDALHKCEKTVENLENEPEKG